MEVRIRATFDVGPTMRALRRHPGPSREGRAGQRFREVPMALLISILIVLAPLAGSMRGTATFYCSDGRDGSPVSRCTRGYGPDDHIAAIDRGQTPWDVGDVLTVRGPRGTSAVRVVDVCACGGSRLIDLPIGVFETVAGDWRPGEVWVLVSGRGRAQDTPSKAVPTLPPTDTD